MGCYIEMSRREGHEFGCGIPSSLNRRGMPSQPLAFFAFQFMMLLLSTRRRLANGLHVPGPNHLRPPFGRLCRPVLHEIFNNRAGLINIPGRDDDFHGSCTASRRSVGHHLADKLIFQPRRDMPSPFSRHFRRSACRMPPQFADGSGWHMW